MPIIGRMAFSAVLFALRGKVYFLRTNTADFCLRPRSGLIDLGNRESDKRSSRTRHTIVLTSIPTDSNLEQSTLCHPQILYDSDSARLCSHHHTHFRPLQILENRL